MRKRELETLDRLFYKQAVEALKGQSTGALEAWAKRWCESYVEQRLMADELLEPLGEIIEREAKATLLRLLGDQGFVRRLVDENISSAVANALINYGDSFGYTRCARCGAPDSQPAEDADREGSGR